MYKKIITANPRVQSFFFLVTVSRCSVNRKEEIKTYWKSRLLGKTIAKK